MADTGERRTNPRGLLECEEQPPVKPTKTTNSGKPTARKSGVRMPERIVRSVN